MWHRSTHRLATVTSVGGFHSSANPGYLLYIGDYTTQLYGDYFINHYKDPYQTTSIMESRMFFFVAQLKKNDIPPRSLTAIAPEKLQNAPNRKNCRLPVPPFFRGELLNFGGVPKMEGSSSPI